MSTCWVDIHSLTTFSRDSMKEGKITQTHITYPNRRRRKKKSQTICKRYVLWYYKYIDFPLILGSTIGRYKGEKKTPKHGGVCKHGKKFPERQSNRFSTHRIVCVCKRQFTNIKLQVGKCYFPIVNILPNSFLGSKNIWYNSHKNNNRNKNKINNANIQFSHTTRAMW